MFLVTSSPKGCGSIVMSISLSLSLSVCVCVHVSVYLSVREDISRTIRAIFTNSVRVAYGRGSVLLRQGDKILRGTGNFGGHSKALAILAAAVAAAFAAKGII